MNSELFMRQRNTTEDLEQTGASMDDSTLMFCHSSKNIWSLLRTMSIARDSIDKQLSGCNSAMSVDAKLPIRACGTLAELHHIEAGMAYGQKRGGLRDDRTQRALSRARKCRGSALPI